MTDETGRLNMTEGTELKEFLIKRGVDDNTLERMQEDKIDLQVICLMSDDALKEYLPKYGDRLAIVSLAKTIEKRSSGQTERQRRLFDNLKEKVKEKMKSHSHFTRATSQVGNANARKVDRRVEVGWVDYSFVSNDYKQLYQKKGGGIRHEKFDVDTSVTDILTLAKMWFFPNGKNRHGNLTDFDINITDSSYFELDGKTTVGEMYEQTKVKMLRLYMASKKKSRADDVESSQISSETSNPTTSLSRTSSCESVSVKKPRRACKFTPGRKGTQLRQLNQEQHDEDLTETYLLDDVLDDFETDTFLLESAPNEDKDRAVAFGPTQMQPDQQLLPYSPPAADIGNGAAMASTALPQQPTTSTEQYIAMEGDYAMTDFQESTSVVLNEDGLYDVLLIKPTQYLQPVPSEFSDAGTPTVQFHHNHVQLSPGQASQQPGTSEQVSGTATMEDPHHVNTLEQHFSDAGTPTVQFHHNHVELSPGQASQQSGTSEQVRGTATMEDPHNVTLEQHFSDAGTPNVQFHHNNVELSPGQASQQSGTSEQVRGTATMEDPHHVTLEQPRSPSTPPDPNQDFIKIHRSIVQREMISVFMDPAIVGCPVKYEFIDEAGADAKGVSRDVYSAFWKYFFETSSVGETERVPALIPDYGREEWEAIGRILLKGYVDTGYYPLKLSYAFSCAAIYGESEVNGDILIESLRLYMSDTDRHVVDKALHGEELDKDEQDDFLDMLDRVSCHSIPSKDAIRPLIINIAHKELIQEPKYALDAIASVICPELLAKFPSPAALSEMYTSKAPTARKVIKLLDSSPGDQEQAASFSFLKRFIKGLDNRNLLKFMRHITGSEYICTESIKVTFNRMRGAGRAPQAHTCGPLLELPSTYASYPEFRNEFMNILDGNYMNMDIV